MEITGIIIATLLIIWFIASMFRTHFENKWYNRGMLKLLINMIKKMWIIGKVLIMEKKQTESIFKNMLITTIK